MWTQRALNWARLGGRCAEISKHPWQSIINGVVRWPAAGDTAGSSLRRLSSLQRRIYTSVVCSVSGEHDVPVPTRSAVHRHLTSLWRQARLYRRLVRRTELHEVVRQRRVPMQQLGQSYELLRWLVETLSRDIRRYRMLNVSAVDRAILQIYTYIPA